MARQSYDRPSSRDEPQTMPDYGEMLAACQRHDESAWKQLYSMCIPIARRHALRMGFSTTDADDISQEAMMALTRNIGTVENPFVFARTVAARRCIDRVRRRRLETSYEEEGMTDDDLPPDRAIAQHWIERWSEQKQTEEQVEARLLAMETLREGLLALGDPCHALLERKFNADRSYREIAQEQDIPEPQVGVYIGRCIKRLKSALQKNAASWSVLQNLWQEIR